MLVLKASLSQIAFACTKMEHVCGHRLMFVFDTTKEREDVADTRLELNPCLEKNAII
jgi:hypothetical protein